MEHLSGDMHPEDLCIKGNVSVHFKKAKCTSKKHGPRLRRRDPLGTKSPLRQLTGRSADGGSGFGVHVNPDVLC